MNDALLRLVLILIAAMTALTGAIQLFFPDPVLALIAMPLEPLAPHLFATVGMFMLITGALFLQSLLARSEERAIPLWIGVQKLAAALLVTYGCFTGVFLERSLGVAGVDLVSGILCWVFWRRLPR